MRTDLQSSILWLAPSQLLELRRARGRMLTVVVGHVWLTQEGDLRDVVLRAGESYRVERDGVTLVQTLGGAAYVLVERNVEAHVIAPDGSRELVQEGKDADEIAVTDLATALPDDWNSVRLHQWVRHERARAIAEFIAEGIDGVAGTIKALGRRIATLLAPAAAALAR